MVHVRIAKVYNGRELSSSFPIYKYETRKSRGRSSNIPSLLPRASSYIYFNIFYFVVVVRVGVFLATGQRTSMD